MRVVAYQETNCIDVSVISEKIFTSDLFVLDRVLQKTTAKSPNCFRDELIDVFGAQRSGKKVLTYAYVL